MLSRLALILMVLTVGLLARLNSLPGSFIYDDISIVKNNPVVERCNPMEIFTTSYWKQPGYGLFRPATIASFCLNRKLLGPAAWGFHSGNLAIHLFNSMLLAFMLLGPLAINPWTAAFFALLFSLHPMLVEAVNSLVGRAELLVGSAFLVSVWVMLAGYAKRATPYLVKSLLPIVFLFGLLSKESGVVIPVLLLMVAVFLIWSASPNQTIGKIFGNVIFSCRRQWPLLLLYAGVLLVVVLWRQLVLDKPTPSAVVLDIHSPLQHVLVALQISGKALFSLVAPWHLQWDYAPLAMVPTTTLWEFEPMMGLTTWLGIGVWTWWKRRFGAMLWLITFTVSIATILQIIPIGTIFADRLMYLPVLASCLVLPIISRTYARQWPSRLHWISLIGASLIIVAVFTKTFLANPYWQNELDFWIYTDQQAPRSMSAKLNLARLYQERGDLPTAETYLRQNIALSPKTSLAHEKLGDLLLPQKRFAEAQLAYEQMSRLQPQVAKHFNALALCAIGLRQYDKGEKYLIQALKIAPGQLAFRNNLAALLVMTKQYGKLDELTVDWTESDRLNLADMLFKGSGCLKNPSTIAPFRLATQAHPELGVGALWQRFCGAP